MSRNDFVLIEKTNNPVGKYSVTQMDADTGAVLGDSLTFTDSLEVALKKAMEIGAEYGISYKDEVTKSGE